MSKVATGLMIGFVVVLAGCGGGSSKSASTSTTAATTATTAATTTTSGAPAQTVTITPSTGLTDGQNVQIVGKGFVAGKQYGITECGNKGAATGAGDCNLRGIKVATADSSGTVTSTFPVAKGPFGSNNIDCSVQPGCIVSVANAGSANPTEVGTAMISFS